MSFEFLNQLPTPADIKRDYPLSPELRELKKHRDLMISDVITGKDSRVLVIIGPCSADNEDSVCDYIGRLWASGSGYSLNSCSGDITFFT